MIIDSFSNIGNAQVVENLFPERMIRDLLESNYLKKFVSTKQYEKKFGEK